MNPLWLALHLPCLPLEANGPLLSPSAVVEQGRILVCDAAARQAGVAPGTGAAAARMLAPTITLRARNAARETAALESLACWAGSFTPRISLVPDALLLEIGSCLGLFRGLQKLLGAATDGIRAQGYTVAPAVAPTPLGALWLARSGTAAVCVDRETLHRHLEALPLAVLPAKAAAALAGFGAAGLADVRQLPAAALGRRIGADSLQLLARAFGESQDPRADFVFPAEFGLTLELPAAVDNAAALLFAARRLTGALAGWLAARQAGVRQITLRLQHRHAETPLVLQFADLVADNARIERLLRERLDRLPLPAAVEALRLEARQVAFRAGRNRTLFDDAHAAQDDIGVLLERLCARLGEQQVYRLALHDDHRPECAGRHAMLFEKLPAHPPPRLARPLWLLDPPESLAEVAGRPYRRGHLRLLAGPERIEAGWWDGGEAAGDLRRDYFIALAADSSWLWIYRERRAPGGWFLQGYFA